MKHEVLLGWEEGSKGKGHGEGYHAAQPCPGSPGGFSLPVATTSAALALVFAVLTAT